MLKLFRAPSPHCVILATLVAGCGADTEREQIVDPSVENPDASAPAAEGNTGASEDENESSTDPVSAAPGQPPADEVGSDDASDEPNVTDDERDAMDDEPDAADSGMIDPDGSGAQDAGVADAGASTGSDAGMEEEPEVDPSEGCTAITAAALQPHPTLSDLIVEAPYEPNTGTDNGVDKLRLFFPVAEPSTGSFSLGEGPEDNYATCRHCVLALEDASPDGIGKFYFAASGSITIDAIEVPLDGRSRGTMADVKLIEVNIVNDASEPVVGGECLWADEVTWDTY